MAQPLVWRVSELTPLPSQVTAFQARTLMLMLSPAPECTGGFHLRHDVTSSVITLPSKEKETLVVIIKCNIATSIMCHLCELAKRVTVLPTRHRLSRWLSSDSDLHSLLSCLLSNVSQNSSRGKAFFINTKTTFSLASINQIRTNHILQNFSMSRLIESLWN